METPKELKYTEEHEWVRVEGNSVLVGITDYAQGELGDIVFMELPEVGIDVEHGSVFGTIEAVKTHPENINQRPYGDGWMLKIELSDPSELNMLMDADAYLEHVGEDD